MVGGGFFDRSAMSTPASNKTRKERKAGFFTKMKEKKKETSLASISQAFSRKRARITIDNSRFKMLPMCGFEVKVPEGLTPYTTQKMMMVKILSALNASQNVLAESPTGSGKTLALLASTCAWISKYQKTREESRLTCNVHGMDRSVPTFVPPGPATPATPATPSTMDTSTTSPDIIDLEEDANGGFVDVTPKTQVVRTDNDGFFSRQSTYEDELQSDFVGSPAPPKKMASGSLRVPFDEGAEVEKTPQPAPPTCTCLPRVRIYYGTRTHKQIGQVVKEFRRLPYAGEVKHTIMASREQSCINDAARRAPDITAHCKELISEKGLGCQYRTNMSLNRLNQNPRHMRNHVETYADVVFDMEDLVEALKTSKPAVCPYFTSTRILTQDADIIFCPFSYLVDPIIRNSSDVTLKNSIVILDEAHNIEDTCREAASFTFYEKELAEAMCSFKNKEQEVHEAMSSFVGKDVHSEQESYSLTLLQEYSRSYAVLTSFLKDLWSWFVEMATPVAKMSPDPYTKNKSDTKSWAFLADSLVNERTKRKLITPPNSPEHERIQKAFSAFTARPEDGNEATTLDAYRPSTTSLVVLEKWMYFQEYFANEQFRRTYRLNVLMEDVSGRSFSANQQRGRGMRDGQGPKNIGYSQMGGGESVWMDSRAPLGMEAILEGYKTSVSLWCMSPELTFMSAFDTTRSVILASGTLCPIETLKTELGMAFKVQMEGSQVIPREQIFASVLPVGPAGSRISVTYANMKNSNVIFSQIAEIIENVCMTVPNGVLCFVPSYRVLKDITKYMEDYGLDQKIGVKKVILEEPRRSSDLNSLMTTFDDVIANPREFGREVDGALMFAVFRGKVSEGIDFADEKARAVISVGIPYPMWTDGQVIEKRKYNDENSKTKGILTGEQWYGTQGYRALNQALGRCLRHKNDWGALILIDERLAQQAFNGARAPAPSMRVSKWIRDQLVVYSDYHKFQTDLSRFVQNLSVKEEPKPAKAAITID